MNTKDREKLLFDKSVVETKFRKFRADMQANIDRIQRFLDGEAKRPNDLDSEKGKLALSGTRLKHQLQLRSNDSQKIEDW